MRWACIFNTLRPRQNERHFADDIFKYIFVNENVWIPVKISLKYVPKGPINNIPALVEITAWRRSGDKPLSEPMMSGLPTHICNTWPHYMIGYNICPISLLYMLMNTENNVGIFLQQGACQYARVIPHSPVTYLFHKSAAAITGSLISSLIQLQIYHWLGCTCIKQNTCFICVI